MERSNCKTTPRLAIVRRSLCFSAVKMALKMPFLGQLLFPAMERAAVRSLRFSAMLAKMGLVKMKTAMASRTP